MFLKQIINLFQWIAIALGALLCVFLAINAFDETLDPEAKAVLNAAHTVIKADNAYFYWVGIYTSPTNNPVESGSKCIAAQRKASQFSISDQTTIPECNESNEIKYLNEKLASCDLRTQSCLAQYTHLHATVNQLAKQNQVLLTRYDYLLKFTQYDDTYSIAPIFIFKVLPSTLYQAISAVRLQDGDPSGFIQNIKTENKFYRVVLSGNTSLIAKMIGRAELERSARLISEAVRMHPSIALQYQTDLLEIAHPMNSAELNLKKTMESEFRLVVQELKLSDFDKVSMLHRLLFHIELKPNATVNQLYHNMMALASLSEIPTNQYLAAEKTTMQQLGFPPPESYFNLIYNPVGKILASFTVEPYNDYIRDIIDADGLLRLTTLQIQIAAQKIPEAAIPNFLNQAGSKLSDPYTGHPMLWDRTRGLYFRGYGNHITDKNGFVSVKLHDDVD